MSARFAVVTQKAYSFTEWPAANPIYSILQNLGKRLAWKVANIWISILRSWPDALPVQWRTRSRTESSKSENLPNQILEFWPIWEAEIDGKSLKSPCCRKDGWSLSSWSPLLLVGRSPWQAESCRQSRWRSGRFGRTRWNSSWCSCPGSLLPVVIYVKLYVSGTGDAKRFYFNLIQHNCESKSSFKRLKFESCFLSRPVQPHI